MAIAWVDTTQFRRSTRVLSVVDVVESTRLLELDAHDFVRRWHAFVESVRARLPGDSGRMHRSLGDGLMLEFTDAQGCVQCALAMHAWFREANEGLAPERQLHLRIGAHLAQFLADEHDIYGTDVNLTSRIATLAGAGELVVSAVLREQLGGLPGVQCTDLGECHVKHVTEPVHAYRIGPPGPTVHRPASGTGSLAMRPGLAVLPFTTVGAAVRARGTSRLLTEEMSAALVRTGQLQILSQPADAGHGAASLMVAGRGRLRPTEYLLTGHVGTNVHRFALVLQLREAASGIVIWAESVQGEPDELGSPDAALPGELACKALSAIMAHELERSRRQALPRMQGYTLLLAAVSLLHRLQPDAVERALAMLEHLTECNRDHPDAHAWLAYARVLHVQQGWSGNLRSEAARALRHSQRALECEPQSVLPLVMDGLVRCELGNDGSAALLRASEALECDARDPLAWLLRGRACAMLAQPAATLQATERALQLWPLLPLRPVHDAMAAVNLLLAGAHHKAAALGERAVRSNPRLVQGWQALALARASIGDPAGAQAAAQQLLLLAPRLSLRALVERSAASASVAKRLEQALAASGLTAA